MLSNCQSPCTKTPWILVLLIKHNPNNQGLEKVPAPPEHLNTFLCLFHALSFTVICGASQYVLLATLSPHPGCRVGW